MSVNRVLDVAMRATNTQPVQIADKAHPNEGASKFMVAPQWTALTAI